MFSKIGKRIGSLDDRFRSAVRDKDADLVEKLLEKGANPNYFEAGGDSPMGKQTAIMDACDRNDLVCLKLLLDAGADPNRADAMFHTPLSRWCERAAKATRKCTLEDLPDDFLQIARLLFRAGAKLHFPRAPSGRPKWGGQQVVDKYPRLAGIEHLVEAAAQARQIKAGTPAAAARPGRSRRL